MQIPLKSNTTIITVGTPDSSNNQCLQKKDSVEKESFSEKTSESVSSPLNSSAIKLPKNNFLISSSGDAERSLSPKSIIGAVSDFRQSTPEQTTERKAPISLNISAIRNSSNQTSGSNIVDLSSGDSSELEIERASFLDSKPRFEKQNKNFYDETMESGGLSNHESSNGKGSPAIVNSSPPLHQRLGNLDVSMDSAYNEGTSDSLEKLVSLQVTV